MNLVWKLLRQHLSIPQMAGFFFANLFGMIIVLLSVQFYQDVIPVFTAEDSFMRSDFLIVNKKIGTAVRLVAVQILLIRPKWTIWRSSPSFHVWVSSRMPITKPT